MSFSEMWKVVHDGSSRPMIIKGMRTFSIDEFVDGKWDMPKTKMRFVS